MYITKNVLQFFNCQNIHNEPRVGSKKKIYVVFKKIKYIYNMGKKHSLTTDQKKKKEYYNLLLPSKKKSYFPKKIFLFLLNLQKKNIPRII